MKTLYLLCILVLLACVPASAQCNIGGCACRDNCGDFTGDCTACHITEAAGRYIAEGYYYCPSCGSGSMATVRPQVPMQPGKMESVVAWVKQLVPKPDPKYQHLAAMTPERHVQLMQRAVRLKLDGATLGACSHAFKAGTLERLPAEIFSTQKKLAAFYALR